MPEEIKKPALSLFERAAQDAQASASASSLGRRFFTKYNEPQFVHFVSSVGEDGGKNDVHEVILHTFKEDVNGIQMGKRALCLKPFGVTCPYCDSGTRTSTFYGLTLVRFAHKKPEYDERQLFIYNYNKHYTPFAALKTVQDFCGDINSTPVTIKQTGEKLAINFEVAPLKAGNVGEHLITTGDLASFKKSYEEKGKLFTLDEVYEVALTDRYFISELMPNFNAAIIKMIKQEITPADLNSYIANKAVPSDGTALDTDDLPF